MARRTISRIDELPGDQRAVLSLLVRRGRAYAQIAGALRIEDDEVRARAHAALGALAPARAQALERAVRERIDDYVLDQQEASERLVTYDEIEGSPAALAYVDALEEALAPLRAGASPTPSRALEMERAFEEAHLPGSPAHASPAEDSPTMAPGDGPRASQAPVPRSGGRRPRRAKGGALPRGAPADATGGADSRWAPGRPRVSRRGGAALLGLIAAGAIAAIVLALTGGSGPSHASAKGQSASSNGVHIDNEIPLKAASGSAGAPVGVAAVVTSKEKPGFYALALTAEKLAPTHGSFYVVWLYNSPSSFEPLGKAPAVGKNGLLAPSITPLSSHAGSFGELIITKETSEHPTTPGEVVLRGKFALH
jgi:hypothetical protein